MSDDGPDVTTLGMTDNVRQVFYIIERLHDDPTTSTVKSATISKRTEMTTKEVGQALDRLREHGAVESWGNSTPTTWVLFPEHPPEAFRH